MWLVAAAPASFFAAVSSLHVMADAPPMKASDKAAARMIDFMDVLPETKPGWRASTPVEILQSRLR
jgi:hypothetical protein